MLALPWLWISKWHSKGLDIYRTRSEIFSYSRVQRDLTACSNAFPFTTSQNWSIRSCRAHILHYSMDALLGFLTEHPKDGPPTFPPSNRLTRVVLAACLADLEAGWIRSGVRLHYCKKSWYLPISSSGGYSVPLYRISSKKRFDLPMIIVCNNLGTNVRMLGWLVVLELRYLRYRTFQ